MWLFSRKGFYSVVQKEGPGVFHVDQLTVRCRVRMDLVRFCKDMDIPESQIIGSQAGVITDYPWRVVVHRDDWAMFVGREIGRLDYPNFKAEILERFGEWREKIYTRVWAILLDLENEAVHDELPK